MMPDSDSNNAQAQPLLQRRHALNSTSQLAIVGANLCPIQSLDYEIIENDFFKQDWRTRNKLQIFQYVFSKAAVENEKKMRASNQEQGKVCREIDRLRAALKDAEKKAAELNTPVIAANTDTGHARNYGNSELKYNGNMHPYNIKDTQPTGTLHLTQFTTASAAPTGPYAEQFNVQPHGSYSHQVNAHS